MKDHPESQPEKPLETPKSTGNQDLMDCLQRLIEQTSDPFWACRADLSKGLYFSPCLADIWGISIPDWMNDPRLFLKSIHPADLESCLENLKDCMEGPADFEYRIVRPDGKVRWIRSRGMPIRDESGESVWIAGFCHDVTEEKVEEVRLQDFIEKIHESRRLEALRIFAGGIANDFNNLLTGIFGQVDSCLEQLPAGSAARQNLERVLADTERATDLTRSLLACSGNIQTRHEERANPNAFLESLEGAIRKRMSSAHRLALELDEDVPFINADRSQFRQMLLNLAINAIEALGDREGTIAIRSRCMICGSELFDDLDDARDMEPGVYAGI